jgi:hypothetical protein
MSEAGICVDNWVELSESSYAISVVDPDHGGQAEPCPIERQLEGRATWNRGVRIEADDHRRWVRNLQLRSAEFRPGRLD